MPHAIKLDSRLTTLCTGFIGLLVASALLRWSGGEMAGLATPIYISSTILFAVLFTRVGLNFQSFGFGPALTIRHILLTLVGVVAVLLTSEALDLIFADTSRDVSRFNGVEGSVPELIKLLLLSWTIAAVGEELAFRIVLMQGLQSALGNTRTATLIALVVQAVVFGIVHLYQGPAGVIGTILNGLIYGGLVLAARGAIWPAFLAHGLVNTIGLISLHLGAA